MTDPRAPRPSSLSTRLATVDDVDAVLDLVRRCIGHMRDQGIDQWDEVYPDRGVVSGDMQAGSLHVAAIEGHPLAAVFTLDGSEDPAWAAASWSPVAGRIAVVHRLMVDPALQGRGIARQLMVRAEASARAAGYAALHLDCFSKNPGALRLYQALGYRDCGGVMLRKGLFRCFEKRL